MLQVWAVDVASFTAACGDDWEGPVKAFITSPRVSRIDGFAMSCDSIPEDMHRLCGFDIIWMQSFCGAASTHSVLRAVDAAAGQADDKVS